MRFEKIQLTGKIVECENIEQAVEKLSPNFGSGEVLLVFDEITNSYKMYDAEQWEDFMRYNYRGDEE